MKPFFFFNIFAAKYIAYEKVNYLNHVVYGYNNGSDSAGKHLLFQG